MEHTAHSGKFLHDGKTVGVRLAVVHDDGEVQLLRQRELINEISRVILENYDK